MSLYKAGSIDIDNLTIRVPSGWQGDPVFLARKISEKLQSQANEIQSTKQINISVQGYYAGIQANGVAEDFSQSLARQLFNQRANQKSTPKANHPDNEAMHKSSNKRGGK